MAYQLVGDCTSTNIETLDHDFNGHLNPLGFEMQYNDYRTHPLWDDTSVSNINNFNNSPHQFVPPNSSVTYTQPSVP